MRQVLVDHTVAPTLVHLAVRMMRSSGLGTLDTPHQHDDPANQWTRDRMHDT